MEDDINQVQEATEYIESGMAEGKLVIIINTRKIVGLKTSEKTIGVTITSVLIPTTGGLLVNIYIGKGDESHE